MRFVLLAALAVSATSALSPATAQTMQTMKPTTVTLTAEAHVERAPDIAEITAGVVTLAPTAAAASRANAEQMARVIAAVRAARIAEADIQTVGLSLQPQYDYQDRKAPRLTGYQAQNTVSVRLHDLARAGTVIDALVASGSNQIGGPNFRIADEDAVFDLARTAAVRKARARADLYAHAMGLHVRRIVRLDEGGGEPFARPQPMMRTMAVSSAESSTPVAPGEIGLTARVTIEFEVE